MRSSPISLSLLRLCVIHTHKEREKEKEEPEVSCTLRVTKVEKGDSAYTAPPYDEGLQQLHV